MGDSKPELDGPDLTQAIELSTIPDGGMLLGHAFGEPALAARCLQGRRGVGSLAEGFAPSTELRKWFGHDPARWDQFCRRYAGELHQHADLLSQVRSTARQKRVTLVYSAHDEAHNDAIVLRNLLLGRPAQPKAVTAHR